MENEDLDDLYHTAHREAKGIMKKMKWSKSPKIPSGQKPAHQAISEALGETIGDLAEVTYDLEKMKKSIHDVSNKFETSWNVARSEVKAIMKIADKISNEDMKNHLIASVDRVCEEAGLTKEQVDELKTK